MPGTALTVAEHYGWNYRRALESLGRPYCGIDLPERAVGDMQVSAQYVVHAIRSMHEGSRHKVVVLGGSQGATLPRWALRFWPEVRPMVASQIGLAGPNRGGFGLRALCLPDSAVPTGAGCLPAMWQLQPGSAFVGALNFDGETFPGIAYTQIASHLDAAVPPADAFLAGSSRHVANLAVDEVCPGRVADHLAVVTFDAVAFALALDAVEHPGRPADPSRLPAGVCARVLPPELDPAQVSAGYVRVVAAIAEAASTARRVPAEPPLRCYAVENCRQPLA
ncbi:MAG: lipase [Sporichthyaceae bacterium]